MSKEIGITVKKHEDFSEWYTQVVLKSELADYTPIKGFMVLRPYGFAIWDRIKNYFTEKIKSIGVQEAYFPFLIPESLLKKEASHFAGFVPEVFWVERAGDEKLGERLAARPTSEAIAYASFAKWIRSWRDLPLKLNFWNSVLRAEIKSTKPFIRTSEFLWQEGHTAHATLEEVEKEVFQILDFYVDLIENLLAIPVLGGYKSDKEKFVGALYTTTLEALMPDKKVMQMATSHNLGQNFSKPFEIRFIGNDKKEHYAWQSSWGISWRLIGAMIMAHGDSKGLVLPPRIAPIQVVIVPIFYKDADESAVRAKTKRVKELLEKEGIRVKVDDRQEYSPGWKFNEWEMKGVPLRIEIGPRDVREEKVVLVRRDNYQKIGVPDDELLVNSKSLLEDIQTSLLDKARIELQNSIKQTGGYEEFRRVISEEGGFVKSYWCESPKCEQAIKDDTGADIRVIPFTQEAAGLCIYCKEKAKKVVYFGRAY